MGGNMKFSKSSLNPLREGYALLKAALVLSFVITPTSFSFAANTATPTPPQRPLKELIAQYGEACKIPSDQQPDTVKANCTTIKISKRTTKVEAAKIAITTAAVATLTGLAFMEGITSAVCNGIGYGVMGANTVADIATAVVNSKESKDATSGMTETFTKLGTTLTGVLTGSMAGGKIGGKLAANMATKAAGSNATKASAGQAQIAADNAAEKAGKSCDEAYAAGRKASDETVDKAKDKASKATGACVSQAVSLGISILGMAATLATSKQSEKSSKSTLKDIVKNAADIRSLSLNSLTKSNTAPGDAAGIQTAKTTGSSDDDSGKAGYEAAKAAVDAMKLSKPVKDILQKSLGGKDLTAFAANAPTDPGQMNSYVSSALGTGAAGAKALDQFNDKIGAAVEKVSADKSGMRYASAQHKKAKASNKDDDLDLNKLMKDMMGKVNANEETKEEPQRDLASESVYRRLDMLTPDQIEASKDISLFTRVEYRYRKSSGKLDALNWALPENQ